MRTWLPTKQSRSVTDMVLHFLLEEATNTFVSAVLTPESQKLLLERVPPIHPVIHAHHATIGYKPKAEVLERFLQMHGQPMRIPVIGTAADDKAQAVLVQLNSSNAHPHITISIAEDVKPVYSNELLERAQIQRIPAFTLDAVFVIEALL